MKEIKIKIIINNQQYIKDILINNQIIHISKDNLFHFTGDINKVYNLKVITMNNILIYNLLITEKYNNIYYIFYSTNHKTLHLYDKNYKNLYIGKGIINLWQRNIQ